MCLRDFLNLFFPVCCNCVTVQEGSFTVQGVPCFFNPEGKIYFEENTKEYILKNFDDIADRLVSGFNIIGGGSYPVELVIFIDNEL